LRTSGESRHAQPSHHRIEAVYGRASTSGGQAKISRQGTAAPESTSLLNPKLNMRTTKLHTISKGFFSAMKTWVRKTLSVGVLAAGALLFGPGVAHADVHQTSYDNNGILNGAQLVAPVSVPVNIVGNAIGVAGEANAAGVGKNITEGGKVSQKSHDNNGIANGLQAYLPVNVPVNVVGNAVAVLGEANAAGAGVNGRKTESATVTEHGKQNGTAGATRSRGTTTGS
jgi:hypothetical protein